MFESLKKIFRCLFDGSGSELLDYEVPELPECDSDYYRKVMEEKEDNDMIEDFSTINRRKTLKVNDEGIIYYYVDNYTKDFSLIIQKIIFNNMWTYWSTVLAPIRFVKTLDKEKAQVKIFFRRNGDEDLPAPFKSQSLAYAFAPHNGQYSGHMYINDAKEFDLQDNEEEVNTDYGLLKVLTHEAGHLLNISHSDDKEDIMYYRYQRNNWIKITDDTKEGAKLLYQFEIKKAQDYLYTLYNN